MLIFCMADDKKKLSVNSKFSHYNIRLNESFELTGYPKAIPLLKKVDDALNSNELKASISFSRTLQMLRERVRTSLFHLNLVFEVVEPSYPYEPPFHSPFPFRPTLETLFEAFELFSIISEVSDFRTPLLEEINSFSGFSELKFRLSQTLTVKDVRVIPSAEVIKKPVDAYVEFHSRLKSNGEIASFPEFEECVRSMLLELRSTEIEDLRLGDSGFNKFCEKVIAELEVVMKPEGATLTMLHAFSPSPFPYRRTIFALERSVLAMDLAERLKYNEGANWHDVEISWYLGNSPKLLPLYHYNRYKYQFAGLLANPEVIIWPFLGVAGLEDIIRLRAAPIYIAAISPRTHRIDRHHNSPLDDFYHDINHGRRMWGYDQRKLQKIGAQNCHAKIAVYREQESFIKDLLQQVSPNCAQDSHDLELRRFMRVLVFETFHETALTPDKESLISDLLRAPATPQPFEVQIQSQITNLEDIRNFDGNLKSGADQLKLDFSRPTTVRYFFDRAPGFLANVDNKLRWGFYDSPFKSFNSIVPVTRRTPRGIADAAVNLLSILGHSAPPVTTLLQQIRDRSGQPELWNYFGIKDADLIRISNLNILNVVAGSEIHANWQKRADYYTERWLPTDAKIADGSFVCNQSTLKAYLEERSIPSRYHVFFRIDRNPVDGDLVMYEDLKNLPYEYLAQNHRNENVMSGAKAISVIDRLWRKPDLQFRTVARAERWIAAAAQEIHQGVLDRNANGARYNPDYNQPWKKLKSRNQRNDLDLLRIAFEARLAIDKEGLSIENNLIFVETLEQIYKRLEMKN